MKKTLFLMSSAILAASVFSPVQAQDDLIYIAVEPCRIVNTRKGLAQPVPKNDHTNFLVSGTAGELFDQGGQQTGGCPAPKQQKKPAAIAAYVVAVPASSSSGAGILTAYPSNQPQPPAGAGATVNFEQGKVVGNTTIISLCSANDCPADGQFAILARDTDEHVIIDVQGYFYPSTPLPSYQHVTSTCSAADVSRLSCDVECPEDTEVVSGGGVPGEFNWYLEASYPLDDLSGWRAIFQTQVQSSSGLTTHAICVTLD
jgi:hypothetical protein